MNFGKCCGWFGVAVLLVACGGGGGGAGAGAADPSTSAGTPATATTVSGSSTGTTGAADPSEGEQLGDLEYKRMQDNINKKTPELLAKFKQRCGYDVNVVIDWSSFGHGKDTLNNLWSNYGVERLVESFESVCKDQTGKDAAKGKIKTIRAVNTKDPKAIKIGISGGTMTATLNWSGSSPGMNESEIGAQITKQL